MASVTLDLGGQIARPSTYEEMPRGCLSLVADRSKGTLAGAWAFAPQAGRVDPLGGARRQGRAAARDGPRRHDAAVPDLLRGLHRRPAEARSRMTAARRALAALGLLVLAAVLTAPPAGAALRTLARRPTDGPSTSPQALAYAVPEAPPYATPQGHFLVHYVTTTTDAPALTDVAGPDGAPGPDGIPDVVEQVGAEAESALVTETGFGYRAPPPDNLDGIQRGGDGRYDIYLLSFGGHGLNGVVGLTVNDPGGSNGSYEVIDSDYSGLVGSRFSADEERRVTIAHELFHAIQLGYVAGGLPTWIAEATAVWMETQVTLDPHNLSFLPALDGAWSEQPLWETGHLHEYGCGSSSATWPCLAEGEVGARPAGAVRGRPPPARARSRRGHPGPRLRRNAPPERLPQRVRPGPRGHLRIRFAASRRGPGQEADPGRAA